MMVSIVSICRPYKHRLSFRAIHSIDLRHIPDDGKAGRTVPYTTFGLNTNEIALR
jgi:hypothetical protein